MPTQIYGRKVGSTDEPALLVSSEGVTTGGVKVPTAQLLDFEIKNLLKQVKTFQDRNIEGYALIEGDPVQYHFTPGVAFVIDGDSKAPERVAAALDPYLEGLELVKENYGTSGRAALAKCILSLYNDQHAFSIGEILGPLDSHYLRVVMAMLNAYAERGETAELRQAGEYVFKEFPRLIELSNAMSDARCDVRKKWDEEHQAEMRRLYPDD